MTDSTWLERRAEELFAAAMNKCARGKAQWHKESVVAMVQLAREALAAAEKEVEDDAVRALAFEVGGVHSVAEYVLYMEHYLVKARTALSTQADPGAGTDALDEIRKLGALCVACMEQNGIVMRRPQ